MPRTHCLQVSHQTVVVLVFSVIFFLIFGPFLFFPLLFFFFFCVLFGVLYLGFTILVTLSTLLGFAWHLAELL